MQYEIAIKSEGFTYEKCRRSLKAGLKNESFAVGILVGDDEDEDVIVFIRGEDDFIYSFNAQLVDHKDLTYIAMTYDDVLPGGAAFWYPQIVECVLQVRAYGEFGKDQDLTVCDKVEKLTRFGTVYWRIRHQPSKSAKCLVDTIELYAVGEESYWAVQEAVQNIFRQAAKSKE